jgi:hypothetical protein
MVADDPATSDAFAASIVECVIELGHRITGCVYRRMDESAIRTQLVNWISDRDVDLIVVCGGIEKTSTPRALAPLATARLGSLDAGGQIVRCGSTLVITLTANATAASVLEGALLRLDPPRIAVAPPPVPAAPPPIPAPTPRAADMTTGSIARIGDLPASVDDGRFVDLRAGRGGLWTLAALAVVAAAGVVLLGVNITKRNQSFLTSAPSDVPIAAAPPPPPPRARHVDPPAISRPAPPPRAPISRRVATAIPLPKLPPVARPAALSVDDDSCDEATCAVHGNERECCTPFRATSLPPSLDHAMVAEAIAGVKAQVLACGASASVTGVVVKLRVQVGGDGHAGAVTIEDSPEVSVGSCVVGVIRSAGFRRTVAGGSFVYRFEL